MFSIFLATNSFYLLSQVVSVFCFFVCVFVSLSSRVYASLAQWLEHWSCKPGVESSNLSWAYTNGISIYLFIHRLVSFYSVRSFINILCNFFSHVVCDFFSCLLVSLFLSIVSRHVFFHTSFSCFLFYFVCFSVPLSSLL